MKIAHRFAMIGRYVTSFLVSIGLIALVILVPAYILVPGFISLRVLDALLLFTFGQAALNVMFILMDGDE